MTTASPWASLSEVIDEKALLTRCLHNLEFAERILALFHERCASDLEELEQAVEAGDAETVARLAHRLTGACANASAFALQARVSDLRNAALERSLPEMSDRLRELRREWSRFTSAMSASVPKNALVP